MTDPIVEKAYAYATREPVGGDLELLVFEHPHRAGLQVPKGTVDDGEEPSRAVGRELGEESGVTDHLGVTHLASDRWRHDRREVVYRRHFFHVPIADDRESWDHEVTGGGEDDGLVFSYSFVPVESVELVQAMDDYLSLLDRR